MVKKRYAHAITGLFLILGIFVVYALVTSTGAWHTPNEVIVTIGDCDVTLQDAINNEWLKEIVTPTTCLLESEFPDAYHLASEIILTVNGYDITMQDAIDLNYFKGTATISSSSSSPSQGHPATEVEVTVDSVVKTLQDAINAADLKEICIPETCPTSSGCECGICNDGCVGTIDCGICTDATCVEGECVGVCAFGDTIDCDAEYTNECRIYSGTRTCTSDGVWDSACSAVLIPRGTDCYGTTRPGACDGQGICVKYSGFGCNCPIFLDDYEDTIYIKRCELTDAFGRLYEGKWQEFDSTVLRILPTLTQSWTEWDEDEDPICGRWVCGDGFWGCLAENRYWAYTNWEIQPWGPPCDPSCSNVACGTTNTGPDGCGGECDRAGTLCSSGTCYSGSCCDPDSCGSNECGSINDGCGGTISCSCPPDGNECVANNVRQYWGYTCESNECVYWYDGSYDESCQFGEFEP